MIDYLYEYQNFIGLCLGCGQGICYVCVVIVDNLDGISEEVCICIIGVYYFDGKKVCIIEGYVQCDENGDICELSLIQQKFVDQFVFQCSYCVLGFVNVVIVLVEKVQCQLIKCSELEQVIEDSFGYYICCCIGYVCYYSVICDVFDEFGLVKEV